VWPSSVRRRTDSPVAPIRKIPPPPRVDSKAICAPSGEKPGAPSFSLESAVRFMGFVPPTRCTKMSLSPPSSPTKANERPSGETLGALRSPICSVRRAKLGGRAGGVASEPREPETERDEREGGECRDERRHAKRAGRPPGRHAFARGLGSGQGLEIEG
jgi:hypothetical protein